MTPIEQPSTGTGHMTAVMRAAPRPGASRALRAALVRGGKIVDERVIPLGEHLTIGPTERSTFVVAAAGLTGSTRLVAWSRGGYQLCLGPGMRGRVAVAGEAAEVSGDAGRAPVPLGDEARGKITVGDAVVLFHLVEAHVAAAQPQLPLSVRQGALDGLDWKTTFIAAFSFLFHFGAVGAVYADFADGIVDDGARVDVILESLANLPAPPIEGRFPDEVKITDKDLPFRPGPPTPSKPGGLTNPGPGRGRMEGPRNAESAADTRAARIARELAAEGDAMIFAIGGKGNGATDRVLQSGGDLPFGPLEGVAGDARGARTGGVAGLTLGGGGRAVRPGEGGGGGCLGCVGDRGRDAVADKVGTQGGPKKPIGTTSVSPPELPVGELPDAGRVVNGLKGLLRACYNHELDRDPTAKGSVRVTATIGPNGEVSGVQAAASGLSSEMVSCVSRVVRGAPFGQPKGGRAMVAIPMSFYAQ